PVDAMFRCERQLYQRLAQRGNATLSHAGRGGGRSAAEAPRSRRPTMWRTLAPRAPGRVCARHLRHGDGCSGRYSAGTVGARQRGAARTSGGNAVMRPDRRCERLGDPRRARRAGTTAVTLALAAAAAALGVTTGRPVHADTA